MKQDFLQFLMTWTLQAAWVTITFAAGLTAMTSEQQASLEWFALVGTALWLIGFGLEVVADRQKSHFNAQPENKGRFINVGLWRWSRHPNYFGEIVLWIGIAVIALPNLVGWQLVTLVSPLFVILLLTRISGVRMLDNRARKLWGQDPEYQSYRAQTPMLIPRPPKALA